MIATTIAVTGRTFSSRASERTSSTIATGMNPTRPANAI